MVVPRGLIGGLPFYVSSGLDPLSFLAGIAFLIFLLLIPRFSHGHFFTPAGIATTPVTPGALYHKRRASREISEGLTFNKNFNGLHLDILTQNVFEAIQKYVKFNTEESSTIQ